jgi:8-oxo-dGTP diphosphatase
VSPYADVADVEVEVTDALAQEDATAASVSEQIQKLLSAKEPVVLCTNRPVLPWVFEGLGIERRKLEPGSLFVAHHRRDRVVAVEQHDVSFR